MAAGEPLWSDGGGSESASAPGSLAHAGSAASTALAPPRQPQAVAPGKSPMEASRLNDLTLDHRHSGNQRGELKLTDEELAKLLLELPEGCILWRMHEVERGPRPGSSSATCREGGVEAPQHPRRHLSERQARHKAEQQRAAAPAASAAGGARVARGQGRGRGRPAAAKARSGGRAPAGRPAAEKEQREDPEALAGPPRPRRERGGRGAAARDSRAEDGQRSAEPRSTRPSRATRPAADDGGKTREKQAKRDKPDKPEKQKKHRPNANSDAAPAASDAQPATGLTQEEKLILQGKLDQLDDVQLDRVLEFLGPDVGGGDDGQEVDLDLDQLAPNRQRALIQFVDAELEKVKAAAAAGAARPGATAVAAPAEAAALPAASPAFPSLEPGVTPPSTPLTTDAAVAPRPGPTESPAIHAARQHAWEVCSVREVQRQHNLREVRERPGGGAATPQATPPAAAPAAAPEPRPPELMLPPPAMGPAQGAAGAASGSLGAASSSAAAAALSAEQAAGAAAAGDDTVRPDSMLGNSQEVLDMVDFGFGWM